SCWAGGRPATLRGPSARAVDQIARIRWPLTPKAIRVGRGHAGTCFPARTRARRLIVMRYASAIPARPVWSPWRPQRPIARPVRPVPPSPATPGRPARPRRIRVTNHFDVIAQDMPQARPFLDLQMREGDRLALHQVLACHLEQWHRYLPITAAADSRSARAGQKTGRTTSWTGRWRTRH